MEASYSSLSLSAVSPPSFPPIPSFLVHPRQKAKSAVRTRKAGRQSTKDETERGEASFKSRYNDIGIWELTAAELYGKQTACSHVPAYRICYGQDTDGCPLTEATLIGRGRWAVVNRRKPWNVAAMGQGITDFPRRSVA
ncbi:hypothetical protein B296_00032691 [Ensete ventricosum]|uniref:Uncharacterized protein n=1 Tax=Ensete ventricosum TaxID=4639 RepID=A0A427AD31_ENSVE|nr:hypothetical protein B296_00032691 [Ensete ventricosum]